jgi:hypothetical protein
MLREPQVMGVRRFSATNQTRVLGNRFDVAPVTNAARLRQGQHALIDHFGPRPLLWCTRIGTSAARLAAIPAGESPANRRVQLLL